MPASNRFHITLVSPPGSQFSEFFREIGETLLFGLRGLGHPAALAINDFDASAVNIVLGGHLLDETDVARVPANTVFYNFEQVHGQSQWINPVYVGLVRRFRMWDYSERNIAAWRHGCPDADVVHVPLGYVPELTRIPHAPSEDIDVLIYGAINERRAKVLGELQEAGLNVVAVSNAFGEQRDALIARSKIILDVHDFDTKIFEIARVSYLLANRKATVSELDAGTEIEADIRQAVAAVPYEGLVDKCVELAFDDAARRSLAEAGFRLFSQRSESAILAAALEAPVAQAPGGEVELPRRMNVGSGKAWNFEALNVDVDPLWMPDLLADLNLPLPSDRPVDLGRFGVRTVQQGYFDEIHASHVLEHIPKLVVAMESFLRLLREGGVLSVEVPYDLSFGAWQDPTHVRAMNERSWLYYTDWFWYLGWREYRFVTEEIKYLLADYGQELIASGKSLEEVTRTPRAVDAMQVRLRKIALSEAEKQLAMRRWLP
jgi:SAM-dependent methyltransferase